MAKIIVVHSFRGGTGKSNITANVSAFLASKGKRVGIVDTDIQSPGIHVLFGFSAENIKKTLNDYLWGNCEISEAAYNVTEMLGMKKGEIYLIEEGKVYLVPSSIKLNEISRILREGYEASVLNEGYTKLISDLNLDYLLIDTHPGLHEETLLSLATADDSFIVLRPDNQDYQGTKITLEVSKRLEVPNLYLILNKLIQKYDFDAVRKDLETTYDCKVAAVLPLSEDIIENASKGVFYLQNPGHIFSRGIAEIGKLVL